MVPGTGLWTNYLIFFVRTGRRIPKTRLKSPHIGLIAHRDQPSQNMKTIETIAIAVIAATAVIPQAEAVTVIYNASSEFSLASSTNGVWTYGYSTTLGGPLIPYDQMMAFGSIQRHLHNIGSATPSITYNPTSNPIAVSSALYAAQTIVLHPGPNNEYSILRFTAPADGTYNFQGFFYGTDSIGTTTNVAIQENATSFFTGNINGYGIGTALGFGEEKILQSGDAIDFVVGYGSNGSYLYDSTALSLNVSADIVPEPSATLLGGLCSLLLLRRRRR